MKHIYAYLAVAVLFVLAGCSESDDPTGPSTSPPTTSGTTWILAGGYWQTVLDATDLHAYTGYSFGTKTIATSGVPKSGLATTWDIAFSRDAAKLNGGSSTDNGGDVVGVDLGEVDFAAVTADDTVGVTWVADEIDYQIDEWYQYNSTTHQLTPTQYVYSMVDAGGHNYLKFRIDSIPTAGMPPDMGTVWLTYYYQPTADDFDLSGATSTASVDVGASTAYFDFSSGTQVTPADPQNSTEWDIAFYNYDIMQNSGPSGSGYCEAYPAYGELTDPTDIDGFTAQPTNTLFPDVASSAVSGWYDYDMTTHHLSSKNHVYLIRTGGKYYKMKYVSFYANIGGSPVSAWYTFNWSEL